MADETNITAIAERLIERLGEQAFPLLAQEVIYHHYAGDRDRADTLHDVAEAVRKLQRTRSMPMPR